MISHFPYIVGIINVTPDSFSDGGQYNTPDKLKKKIDRLISDGANIIDIGAESTRPNAATIKPREEFKRIQPALEYLKNKTTTVSIDTRNPETAERCLQYKVNWLNDVSGYNNPAMLKIAEKYKLTVVCMHSLTVPADKNICLPENCDVIKEILSWAQNKISYLHKNGIAKNKIIIDPGIGFGKTKEQDMEIISRAEELKALGVKILIGHSRKSFFTLFTDKETKDRDAETFMLSQKLASKGIDYIRVHDVKGHINGFNKIKTGAL